MTLTVDVDEGAARWSEIVAEVEAGRDVVIARGPISVATVERELPPPDRDRVAAAISRIMDIRNGLPPTTVEEILAWRDEGRR